MLMGKTGRQSIRTEAVIEEICERLSDGVPLAEICRSKGMPGLRTVYDWTDADAELAARIARARDAGEDVIAVDCLKISDTPEEGVETVTKSDGSVEERRGDMLGHRKLKVDTRLKLLAKWNPKKYGDSTHLKLSDPNGGPIRTVNVNATVSDADAMKTYLEMLDANDERRE